MWNLSASSGLSLALAPDGQVVVAGRSVRQAASAESTIEVIRSVADRARDLQLPRTGVPESGWVEL